MGTIEPLVEEFLQQKVIAITGVTRSKEDAANLAYRNLKQRGYTVYAVNPNTDTFDGDPCYPSLSALPQVPDGVIIVNRAEVALKLMQECATLGIKRVWTHCSLGSNPWFFMKGMASQLGLASAEMAQIARENGITLIPGACPNMFVSNADGAHAFMRGMLKATGALKQ